MSSLSGLRQRLRQPPQLGRGDGVSEDRSVFVGFDSLFVHGALPLSHTHTGTSSDDSRYLHLPRCPRQIPLRLPILSSGEPSRAATPARAACASVLTSVLPARPSCSPTDTLPFYPGKTSTKRTASNKSPPRRRSKGARLKSARWYCRDLPNKL